MNTLRNAIALFIAIVVSIIAITPFVLAINRFDWGVGLLLVAPLLVWLLLRAGKALEQWARNEPNTPTADPDYPDDSTE